MVLEVRLPFAVLGAYIRRQVVDSLAREDEEGLRFVKVRLRGSVRISQVGQRIKVTLPLKVQGQGLAGWAPDPKRWFDGKLGSRPVFNLEVTGEAEWALDSRWRWPANLELDTTRLAGNLGALTAVLGPWVDARLDLLAETLNQQWQEEEMPRPLLLRSWEALRLPAKVISDPPLFFSLWPVGQIWPIQTRVEADSLSLFVSGPVKARMGLGAPLASAAWPAPPQALPGEALDQSPVAVEVFAPYRGLADWIADARLKPFGLWRNRTVHLVSWQRTSVHEIDWTASLTAPGKRPWTFGGRLGWAPAQGGKEGAEIPALPVFWVDDLRCLDGPPGLGLLIQLRRRQWQRWISLMLQAAISSLVNEWLDGARSALKEAPLSSEATLSWHLEICAAIGLQAEAEGLRVFFEVNGPACLTLTAVG